MDFPALPGTDASNLAKLTQHGGRPQFLVVDNFGKHLASPRRRRHIRHMVMRDVSADMLLGKLRARIEEYGAAIKSFHYEEPQFDGTADDGVIVFLSAKISEFDSAIAKLGKNDAPNSGEAD